MARELREYRMDLHRVRPGESAVDEELLGQLSKLGGKPNWIQADETPACPDCHQPMTFVAQIDSIEHESKENPNSIDALSPEQHYMFGDVGMLFLFFCEDCGQPAAIFQCG